MNTDTSNNLPHQTGLLSPFTRDPAREAEMKKNPEQTTLLLLEGAVQKAQLAQQCLENQQLTELGFHLGRLTSITDALRHRIVFSEDSAFAFNVDDLYEYIDQCIQNAVFDDSPKQLNNALEILIELQNSWQQMLSK
jgi:flagellar protein FliS